MGFQLLLQQGAAALESVDSTAVVPEVVTEKVSEIVEQVQAGKVDKLLSELFDWGIDVGKSILLAVVLYIVGRFLIKVINKFMSKIIDRRNMDGGVKTFLKSFVNILLTIMLIVAVVSALGVDTTSFAALLASAGIAIGMALSGNLQNFAGGILILLLRPFKVGDFVEAQGVSGVIKGIQIFHTIITTPDNKEIFVPNGALSSGTVINYSQNDLRRVDFTVSIEYGEDTEKVKSLLLKLAAEDPRVENAPASEAYLNALSDSSVDMVLRVWTKKDEYWNVFFGLNEAIYTTFNKEGVKFPYPHLTVHTEN